MTLCHILPEGRGWVNMINCNIYPPLYTYGIFWLSPILIRLSTGKEVVIWWFKVLIVVSVRQQLHLLNSCQCVQGHCPALGVHVFGRLMVSRDLSKKQILNAIVEHKGWYSMHDNMGQTQSVKAPRNSTKYTTWPVLTALVS